MERRNKLIPTELQMGTKSFNYLFCESLQKYSKSVPYIKDRRFLYSNTKAAGGLPESASIQVL
jgi:hypothetical protein